MIKKYSFIVVPILIILIITSLFITVMLGSQHIQTQDNDRKAPIDYENNDCIYEYIDPKTGVHYLIYSYVYRGGITPRLNSDGTIMVDDIFKGDE